jgi:hypothetical protein
VKIPTGGDEAQYCFLVRDPLTMLTVDLVKI